RAGRCNPSALGPAEPRALLTRRRGAAALPRPVLEVLLLELHLPVARPAPQLPRLPLRAGLLAPRLPAPAEHLTHPVQLTARVLALALQPAILGELAHRPLGRGPVQAPVVAARLIGPGLLRRAGVVEVLRGDDAGLRIHRQLLLRLSVLVVARAAGDTAL